MAFLHLSISLCIWQNIIVLGITSAYTSSSHSFLLLQIHCWFCFPHPYMLDLYVCSHLLSYTQTKLLKWWPFDLSAACLKFTASIWSGWTQTHYQIGACCFCYSFVLFLCLIFLYCILFWLFHCAQLLAKQGPNLTAKEIFKKQRARFNPRKCLFDGSASARRRKHRGGYSWAFTENWNTVFSIHAMDCSATSPHCLILDKQQREALKTI